MKKYLLLLPLAGMLSCKKNSTESPSINSATSNKIFLTKETIAIKDSASNDIQYSIDYTRNTNGVLTRMVSGAEDLPLTYNSAGLLTSIGQAGNDEDLFTLTYDSNNNLTEGTETMYNSTGELFKTLHFKYTVVDGKISQTAVYNSSQELHKTYNYTYDNKGNVTQEVVKDSLGVQKSSTIYTYGTHNNPWINSAYKFLFNPEDEVDDINKNEILTTKTTTPEAVTIGTHQYTYNNNYPVSEIMTVTSGGTGTVIATSTTQYVYSGL